jgi:hypothetical protein
MKRFFACAFFICLFALTLFAQDTKLGSSSSASTLDKPRVFITDSQSWEMRAASGGGNGAFGGAAAGGARPQTAEIIKTFGERCPAVMVNNIQEKADFIVVLDHEGGKGVLRHRNKVAVFERTSGDTVVSKSTLSLGGSVQEACDAIGKYWADNGARLLAARAARETPTPPPAPAVTAAPPTKPAGALIAISSVPDAADVDIDGAFVGNAPSSIELAPGDHTVAVHKKGFKDWERKIKVSSGNISLRAELEPVVP